MKKVYTIGRDQQSDIVIHDNTDVVSRLHATIRFEGNKMYLIDQSQNGTYINGMRMSPNEEIPISREDVISFANVSDLDWSLVPNPKKTTIKIVGLICLAILLIGAIILFVPSIKTGDTPVVDAPSTINANDDSQEVPAVDTIKTDDINLEAPAASESSKPNTRKAEPVKEQEEEPEEPQEEEPEIPLY